MGREAHLERFGKRDLQYNKNKLNLESLESAWKEKHAILLHFNVGLEDNQKAEGDSAAQQHMLGYKS